MALIKCPKCNHEISDTIKKCIHCGAKLTKPSIQIKTNDIKNDNTRLKKQNEILPIPNSTKHNQVNNKEKHFTPNNEVPREKIQDEPQRTKIIDYTCGDSDSLNNIDKITKIELASQNVKQAIKKEIQSKPENKDKIPREHKKTKKKKSFTYILLSIVLIIMFSQTIMIYIYTTNYNNSKNKNSENYSAQYNDEGEDNDNFKNNIIDYECVAGLCPKNVTIEENTLVIDIELNPQNTKEVFELDLQNITGTDIIIKGGITTSSNIIDLSFEDLLSIYWKDNSKSILGNNSVISKNRTLKIETSLIEKYKDSKENIKLSLTIFFEKITDFVSSRNIPTDNKKILLVTNNECTHCNNIESYIKDIANDYNVLLEERIYSEGETIDIEGVTGFPTLVLYSDNKIVNYFRGSSSIENILEFLIDNNFI